MIGLGTIINTVAIVIGGVAGHFSGKLFRSEQQDAIIKACGISVIFIVVAGAMQGMLTVHEGTLASGQSLLVALSLALGTVVGAVQNGMTGDYATLVVKSILDGIIIMVMSASMGKGCAFSAIPVFVFEGTMTLLARLISPFMTAAAMANLSLIGAVLIFCVGVNLIWKKPFAWPICCRRWSSR